MKNNILYLSTIKNFDELGELETLYTATPIINNQLSEVAIYTFSTAYELNNFVKAYAKNPRAADEEYTDTVLFNDFSPFAEDFSVPHYSTTE